MSWKLGQHRYILCFQVGYFRVSQFQLVHECIIKAAPLRYMQSFPRWETEDLSCSVMSSLLHLLQTPDRPAFGAESYQSRKTDTSFQRPVIVSISHCKTVFFETGKWKKIIFPPLGLKDTRVQNTFYSVGFTFPLTWCRLLPHTEISFKSCNRRK